MTRRSTVLLVVALSIAAFALGVAFYKSGEPLQSSIPSESTQFIRPHSPVIGKPDAKVTIVEFFDPSCESCRAFYPYVKQILGKFPEDVRLVMRYMPLHKGSDEAVRILEAARLQNLFEPVLEALLRAQPSWARHDAPDLSVAWDAAGQAGLDVAKAQRDKPRAEVFEILSQDMKDATALNVRGTPTFFVNGKSLPEFHPNELHKLVLSEVEAIAGR